jgi:hypothetical protein
MKTYEMIKPGIAKAYHKYCSDYYFRPGFNPAEEYGNREGKDERECNNGKTHFKSINYVFPVKTVMKNREISGKREMQASRICE